MPELVRRCVETQRLPGYEHHVVTLDNCYRGSTYVNDCLKAGKWVKASDWLRIWNLFSEGGIYLDGDMEIIAGRNFDALLHHRLFLSKEVGGYWANAALGSEKGHPLLKRYLDRVENNYRGDGDDVFSPGIRCFTDIFWEGVNAKEDHGLFECPVEWFFPFNHLTGKVNQTEETIVYHHYMRSWQLPADVPQPKPSHCRAHCSSYHLGDQLFGLWFMRTAAKRYPETHFSFFIPPQHFKEVQSLSLELPNLEITPRFDQHTTIEWWLGDWNVNRCNPDRAHFVDSMTRLYPLLADRLGLPNWPTEPVDKTSLLLPPESVKPDHALAGQAYDVLFVNSTPMSFECGGYEEAQLDYLLATLVHRGVKVVATHPSGQCPHVPATTSLGLTLGHLADVATRCRFVVGVANAPFLATFNEPAFKTIEGWLNYGFDRVNFDEERVAQAGTMKDFECGLAEVMARLGA